MIYLITDWMNHVCFDSDNLELKDFDEASEFLDESLLKDSPNLESCENQECICASMGHECDSLEELREDYYITEYNEATDRIMWTGTRYVLKQNYYTLEG